MSAIFDNRFAIEVDKELRDDLQKVRENLGGGAAFVDNDAAATGMKSAKFMGEVQGLLRALATLERVHKRLYAPRKEQKAS